jgi:uncharacterized protein YpmS
MHRKLLRVRLRLWLPLLLLVPLVACSPIPGQGHGVVMPCQPAISEAAADRLEERVAPLVQASGSGDFTLQATADEVTSLLVRMLAEHPGESPVEDPRVCFAPYTVYIMGRFTKVLPFEFEGVIAVVPRLVEGRLSVEVTKASAGSLSIPDALLRTSSKTISESLAEWLPDVHFSEIEVSEGEIVVSGHRGQ